MFSSTTPGFPGAIEEVSLLAAARQFAVNVFLGGAPVPTRSAQHA